MCPTLLIKINTYVCACSEAAKLHLLIGDAIEELYVDDPNKTNLNMAWCYQM